MDQSEEEQVEQRIRAVFTAHAHAVTERSTIPSRGESSRDPVTDTTEATVDTIEPEPGRPARAPRPWGLTGRRRPASPHGGYRLLFEMRHNQVVGFVTGSTADEEAQPCG